MSNTKDESQKANRERDKNEELSCLQRLSGLIIGLLENQFARLGLAIGKHPIRCIVACFIMCGLTGIGLLEFYEETRFEKQWVSKGAKVVVDKAWIDQHFPSSVRAQMILASDQNILKAAKIQALMDIYQQAANLETSSGTKLSDICIRAGPNCIVFSVLEVWAYNDTVIRALTDAQVLRDIKTATVSALYGTPIDLNALLSQIERDPKGDIISANATHMTWATEGNTTILSKSLSWETKFISMGKRGHSGLANVYILAHKSANEEWENAASDDMVILSSGYVLVVVFVFSVLGNYNLLEQRAWLSLAGFVCIGLSMLVSVGLSSILQEDYGPLHTVLPFLLLGVGMDNTFVIVAALNNFPPEERDCPIPELSSKVLSSAGVAITVTSLTDVVAFLIGASTVIPALRSFCVYAAIGILSIFFLQATFFTACLVLDIKRTRERRDGCLFCIKLGENYEAKRFTEMKFIPYVFKKVLAPIITKIPVKVLVILATLAMFGININGLVKIEYYFDLTLFIPDDSYASKFIHAQTKYFPELGYAGFIYCKDMPYYELRNELHKLNDLMVNSTYMTNDSTDSWFEALTVWLNKTTDPVIKAMLDKTGYPTSEEYFLNLTYRLATEAAPRTRSNIMFSSLTNLSIDGSRFPFTHITLDDVEGQIAAMDDTLDLITRAGLSQDDCFPFSRFYPQWETNRIIKKELLRNLSLAMMCVFLVGLILIANVITTFIVFLGVIFTLMDVAGSMHYWGLTIDTVTSVVLVLSVGLSIDYSAHIGHMFLRIKGTKEERIKETMKQIGPPVVYGAISTFLAIILLAFSRSHGYRTFFKVNFLVVFYGLFHAMLFVPVLLSIAGPAPYPDSTLGKNLHTRRVSVISDQ